MRGPERHRPGAAGQAAALLAAIEELNPLTWREGPYTILERYLERTGLVLDLLAAGTLEAKRSVVNIASFMRFAADWQAANPAQDPGGLRRLPRRLQGGRRRAADERGAVRGRRRRAPHDPLPGEGPGVPDRHRPGAGRGRVAGPRAGRRLVPARAAARAGADGRHPHRRGAAAPVRRDDPGAGAAPAHDPGRRWGEGRVPVRGGAARRGRRGADRHRSDGDRRPADADAERARPPRWRRRR